MDAHDEQARFLILDRITGERVGECHGASELGQCPNAAAGEVVPCAGGRLVPVEGSGIEGWTLTVTPGSSDGCPLAFLPVRDG